MREEFGKRDSLANEVLIEPYCYCRRKDTVICKVLFALCTCGQGAKSGSTKGVEGEGVGEGKGRIGRVGRMNCVVVALDVLVGVGLAVGSGPGAPVDVVPVVRQ